MNIDLAALRALEREREIPYDTILAAIETALLTAYRHTEGANAHARVEIDRKTGVATVYAQELDAEGAVLREYDDTPHDFGRIAAMTAKQVILQRLREATDEVHFGEYAGRDGDLVTGVVQAHEARAEKGIVTIDLGKVEAVLPAAEQVPGEVYEHGMRIKCVVVHVVKGFRGPQITLSRSHPALVKKLFALEVPEIADGTVEIAAIAREAGHRTKIAVRSTQPGVNAKGACIGPMGQRVRAVMSELHGEKIDIIDWSEDPAAFVGNALSPAKALRVEVVEAARCPAGRPADRLADRHPAGQRARGERDSGRWRGAPRLGSRRGNRVDFRSGTRHVSGTHLCGLPEAGRSLRVAAGRCG